MTGEACFSNAISDSSGRKLPLGEAISESPFSKFWNLKEACEEIFTGFLAPIVSLIQELLMCH